MEIGDPEDQLANDVGEIQSRFSHLGCAGLLIAAFVLLIGLGSSVVGSEAEAVELISEIHEREKNEKVITAETVQPLRLPTITPTPQISRLATETPRSSTNPTATVERISNKPTRTANPTNEPTALTPTTTPVPPLTIVEPTATATATATRDFTVGLMPTPTDNYSRTLKVPILMYHYISVPPEDADIYRNDLSVTPTRFREQMQYLVENGYSTIDLYDLSMAVANKRSLPEKSVILTFDDGYADNFKNAFPVLQEMGLNGTFFIATGFVDAQNPNYMDWSMIEEMAAAGMRIEPHSKTHADLRNEERAFLIYEILGSQETIEAHVGYSPRFFAYPGGRYDAAVIDILKERDFWGGLTTAVGSWHTYDDRFEWTRQRVRFSTSIDLFVDLVD